MGLVDTPFRGLCGYQRLERRTKSAVSCRTYAWGCLAPTSKFSNGRAGKLCDAERGITREIRTEGTGRITQGQEPIWAPDKAEFRARHRERDELPDLASSLRRLVSRAYPEALPDCKIVSLRSNLSMRWRIEKYG